MFKKTTMMNHHLHHQIALTLLKGVGNKRAKSLLAYVGSLEKIFDLHHNIKATVPGLSREIFRNMNREQALEEALGYLHFIEKNEIQTSFFTDRDYPKRLKECADSPILLYKKGIIDFNPPRSIAIVGTRNMTSYGRRLINELLSAIAPFNVQVVSGLALGVDGYAHKKCLELNIPTIGVLGHGLDRIYPHLHRGLAKRMMETPGCGLLTEFPNNTLPDRENFPQRNRIVAGMTDATIVIESGQRGGSLITANLANDYNRDVFTYPGDVYRPFSIGCNHLIANNKAHLITKGDDIVRMMGWSKEKAGKQTNLFEGLDGDEKNIVKTIQEFEKISLDVLSIRLKKPVNILSSLLLGLEIKGKIMTLPGKKYVINTI